MSPSSDTEAILVISQGIVDVSDMGGAIKVIVEYLRSWQESGHKIVLFCSPEAASVYRREGIKPSHNLKILVYREISLNLQHVPKMILKLTYRTLISIIHLPQIVLHNQCYAIFSASALPPDILPAAVIRFFFRRRWMVPVYHFVPNPLMRPGSRHLNWIVFFLQAFSVLVARFATFIVVESKMQRQLVCRRLRVDKRKVLVNSGGIRPGDIDQVAKSKEYYDALFVSRLHPVKGVYDLVQIWKAVVATKKESRLAIIGQASDPKVLRRMEQEIQLVSLEKNITILGLVDERQKYSLMKSSRILLHPSYEDGIPLVFYEALYCGMQIATYYLPTYYDIKPWINSVKVGEIKDLAQLVIRLMGNTYNAIELKKVALEHSWDRLALQILVALDKSDDSLI